MSFTFKVHDVSSKRPYYEPKLIDMPQVYKGLGKFEAFGGPEKVIRAYGPQNGLWRACAEAYNAHRRLELSPDHIWLAIARIAAEHITSKSEELRKTFVNFEGKRSLEIIRNDFVKGSPDNDWEDTFDEFAAQIDVNVKADIIPVFSSNFTTSGTIEKAVGHVILMDAMSRYFKFTMHTLCGFPEITVLGEPEDWVAVGKKVTWLKENLEMGDWVDQVYDFTRQFYYAAKGEPDISWWKSLYREGGGSGGEHFDGHLAVLFPNRIDDKLVVPTRIADHNISHFFARVPVLWKYYDKEFRMRFVAGVPFATILPDGAITPAAAWAIEEL